MTSVIFWGFVLVALGVWEARRRPAAGFLYAGSGVVGLLMVYHDLGLVPDRIYGPASKLVRFGIGIAFAIVFVQGWKEWRRRRVA